MPEHQPTPTTYQPRTSTTPPNGKGQVSSLVFCLFVCFKSLFKFLEFVSLFLCFLLSITKINYVTMLVIVVVVDDDDNDI